MKSLQLFQRLEAIKEEQRAVPVDAEDRYVQLHRLEGRGEELLLMLEDALKEEALQS